MPIFAVGEAIQLRLKLPAETKLPISPVTGHRTPAGFDTTLSAIATANLRSWYPVDRCFYDSALQLSEEVAGLRSRGDMIVFAGARRDKGLLPESAGKAAFCILLQRYDR